MEKTIATLQDIDNAPGSLDLGAFLNVLCLLQEIGLRALVSSRYGRINPIWTAISGPCFWQELSSKSDLVNLTLTSFLGLPA